MAEGLARSITRERAGMNPLQLAYDAYVAAYAGLANAAGTDLNVLLRRLWVQPLGRVRAALADTVDGLRRESTGGGLSERQRVRLQGIADRFFDSAKTFDRPPSEDAVLTLWEFAFR